MPLLCVICHPVARIYIAYLCKKLYNFRFGSSNDMIGAPKFLIGHMTSPRPYQGRFVVGGCYLHIQPVFQKFVITNYEDA